MSATRCVLIGGLLASLLVLGACQPTNDPGRSAASGRAAVGTSASPSPAHEAGRRIWNFRCYYCHGYSGDARTLAASFIDPPPRSFRDTAPASLSREAMLQAVRHGRPGTAMVGFSQTLTPIELEQVVDFVREEFMLRKAANTRYHTAENGWPDHDRYRSAFAFATGQIPLDRPWEQLDEEQTRGKKLFLGACVSCHDRAVVTAQGNAWEIFGVSYPPGNYVEEEEHEPARPTTAAPAGSHAEPAGAIDPYELHETPPKLVRASALERRGERVFQRNCAHCHAADGSGRNWIGSFLDPHPPDFTRAPIAARLNAADVARVTREGLPGSSMPAWLAVLPARDIDAVAAYVAKAFGRPGGAMAGTARGS